MGNEKSVKLEEAFSKLDEIITEMQNAELTLEDTFRLYKQGIELVQVCEDRIEKVESEIKTITEEQNGI